MKPKALEAAVKLAALAEGMGVETTLSTDGEGYCVRLYLHRNPIVHFGSGERIGRDDK